MGIPLSIIINEEYNKNDLINFFINFHGGKVILSANLSKPPSKYYSYKLFLIKYILILNEYLDKYKCGIIP